MKTISEIKGRCRIDDDGHWIWAGALWEGFPRIYAPDPARGGIMRTQTGARVVYQMKTGKPIPEGLRAFAKCGRMACVRPDCAVIGTTKEWGEAISATGRHKKQMHRILANRRNVAKSVKVTPEIAAEIIARTEPYHVIAADLGLCEETIGLVKRGKKPLLRPLGGLFTGLLAANDSTRRAA